MQGLVQLFSEAGLDLPLRAVGKCRYSLGGSRVGVRLVRGRLMVRSGAGLIPLMDWLEKQPLPRSSTEN